jgi:hypothetical protein
MPSEWPDGGHNSLETEHLQDRGRRRANETTLPDDPRFFQSATSAATRRVEEAPMRLSNLGRFYSATELGRVYDPIMWETPRHPRATCRGAM